MSGSCPGCLPTGKALAALYESVKLKAIDFMNTNKVSVAIYRTVEGYDFMNAEIAQANGYPIREILIFSE